MNILKKSREEIEELVNSGWMDKANLRHYDVCKELSKGTTAQDTADKVGLSDGRKVREIKKKKCPDCGNTKIH
jgi:hypothetical protein